VTRKLSCLAAKAARHQIQTPGIAPASLLLFCSQSHIEILERYFMLKALKPNVEKD
jgi:hypothetical protein